MKFLLLALIWVLTSFAAEPHHDWRVLDKDWNKWIQTPEPALRKKAEAGDPIAQYFYYQQCVRDEAFKDKPRWARGEKFLEQAAEARVPQAMYELAGDFRESNPARYITLLRQTAETTLPGAQAELAQQYLEGQFLEVDEVKALELTRKAADSQHLRAMVELAWMYACGQGEPRSENDTALKWFRRAADLGSTEAAAEVARRYRFGLGVERDIMEAARYYRRAAEETERHASRFDYKTLLDFSGNPLLHLDPEDAQMAEFFSKYIRAIESADPARVLEVGTDFLEGRHGKPNHLTAYYWLSYASSLGKSEAAALAQKAKTSLSKEQIEQTDRELKNWITYQKNNSRRRQP